MTAVIEGLIMYATQISDSITTKEREQMAVSASQSGKLPELYSQRATT